MLSVCLNISSVFCLVHPSVVFYGCRSCVVLNHWVACSSIFHVLVRSAYWLGVSRVYYSCMRTFVLVNTVFMEVDVFWFPCYWRIFAVVMCFLVGRYP